MTPTDDILGVLRRLRRSKMVVWLRRASTCLHIQPGRENKHRIRFRWHTRILAEDNVDDDIGLGTVDLPDWSLNCKNRTSQFVRLSLTVCDPSSTSYCTVFFPLSLTARLISKLSSSTTLGTSSTWLTSDESAEKASLLRDAIVVFGGVVSKIVSLCVLSRSW